MATNGVHYGSNQPGSRLNRYGNMDRNTYTNSYSLISAPDCITCNNVSLKGAPPQCQACRYNRYNYDKLKNIY